VQSEAFMLAMVAAFLAAQVLQRTPPAPDPPMPEGQRIVARDGDTLVIPTGARVRVIRRTEGTVRIVHNAAARWLAILYDVADPSGASSEGKVDGSFRFDDVEGAWPLGERWQGRGVIEEYLMPQGLLRVGIGITTDAGLVQLFSGSPSSGAANGQGFQDSGASVLYEPTQINGTPVPVIMTVTVNFAMQE
jgi:hypothetical protein